MAMNKNGADYQCFGPVANNLEIYEISSLEA
jgi:hypothetical protein